METLYGMKPIIDKNSKILILGTFPGNESLKLQQYYANTKNHFWIIMSKLFERDFYDDYSMKIEFLLKHNIALWDVIESCEREGSLDSAIRGQKNNSFETFLNEYPNIEYVLFNGKKASKQFGTRLKKASNNIKEFVDLPSTSLTPGKFVKNLDEKIEAWSIIKKLK